MTTTESPRAEIMCARCGGKDMYTPNGIIGHIHHEDCPAWLDINGGDQ